MSPYHLSHKKFVFLTECTVNRPSARPFGLLSDGIGIPPEQAWESMDLNSADTADLDGTRVTWRIYKGHKWSVAVG